MADEAGDVYRGASTRRQHIHEYEAEALAGCLSRYFDGVDVKGVGLSPRVKPYFDERLAHIGKIMRLDPLGLRKLMSKRWLIWLFSQGASWVRRGIQESDAWMPDAGWRHRRQLCRRVRVGPAADFGIHEASKEP